MEWVFWPVALLVAALWAWPASFWYDAGLLEIPDFVEGSEYVILYVGGAKRPFLGSYNVVVRDAATGGIVREPGPSGRFPY